VWPQSLVRYSRTSSRTAAECRHLSGNVLGIKEESRAGIIQALWSYIKMHNLQDKVDRKRIHADAMLRPVRVHVLLIGTLMPIPSADIWRRSDPVQFLAGDGQSLSCAIKSGGRPLRYEPIYATPGTPYSLGYRAQARGCYIKVENASGDAQCVSGYFAGIDEA
jgi:hypothetical protein